MSPHLSTPAPAPPGAHGSDAAGIAAAELREVLDRAAAALAAPDLDALLACESALADAVARLRPLAEVSTRLAAHGRAHADDARLALRRCRRLGASLTEFVGLSLEAQGRAPDYGPRPSPRAQARG